MTYYLKRLEDNVNMPVARYPTWASGIWDGGDHRYVDPAGNLYAAVGYPPCLVDGGRLYNLFPLQSQIDMEENAVADQNIAQFRRNIDMAVAARSEVDLASEQVQSALGYLVATTVPSTSRTYITADVAARISLNQNP